MGEAGSAASGPRGKAVILASWWHHARQKAVVRRRYVARFEIEGEPVPALAVFELGADGWAGVTSFPPESEDYVDHLRVGVRLYRRR